MLNPAKIGHENLTDLSPSPVRCSHFNLRNKKVHSQQYYSYILLIICVISEVNKL